MVFASFLIIPVTFSQGEASGSYKSFDDFKIQPQLVLKEPEDEERMQNKWLLV